MSRLPPLRADRGLDELAERFNQWRSNRLSTCEPIPQPLWDEAARLARRLPISRVAKTLRLSGGELKRHRDGTVEPSRSVPAQAAAPTAFVPVVAAEASAAPGAQVEVEVQRTDGSRLCVRYSEGAPVVDLLRAFLAG